MPLSSAEIASLLVPVPDISREQPPPADLAPDDCVFADKLLRWLSFGFERDGADFTGSAPSERQHIDGHQLGVADLLCRLLPERLDRAAAFHHLTARRQYIGVLGIHRRNSGGIALVEGGSKFVVEFLERCCVLSQRRCGE